MDTHISTTPFGQRKLTLGHVAGQAAANARRQEQVVHKWAVFRDICAIRARLGVSERALTVLDALLSFHPETALTGAGLVVFPSNQHLMLRARGMAAATLRRHIAVLVEAGLIVRRDSANGKRFARKNDEGVIVLAFGFDLAPLVTRAAEFAMAAQEVRAEAQALRRFRESITIARRDIAKMIALGADRWVPAPATGGWQAVNTRYQVLVVRIPRTACRAVLEPLASEFLSLSAELVTALENDVKTRFLSGNASQNERHRQSSNPDSPSDLEACPQDGGREAIGLSSSGAVGNDRRVEMRADPLRADHKVVRATSAIYRQGLRQRPIALAGAASDGLRGWMPTLSELGIAFGELWRTTPSYPRSEARAASAGQFSLSLVNDACPDLEQYSQSGVRNWHELLGAAAVARSALGISPSAWEEAKDTLGEIQAAIVVACVLQRAHAIASPGGYVRHLARKAATGSFSVGPMLMALVAARQRRTRQAVN